MHVTIKNFRRIEYADMALTKPVNVLCGANQAGKSSTLAAIITALTGTLEWCKRQGASVYDLRTWGAKKAEIGLTLGGNVDYLFIERTIAARTQKLEVVENSSGGPKAWTGTTTEQSEQLLDYWSITSDQLSAILSGSQFLAMDAKGQVEFLAAMGGAELTDADLFGKVKDANGRAYSALVRVWSKNSKQGDAELTGAALLDHLEQLSRDARRDAKSEQKRIEGIVTAKRAEVVARPDGLPPSAEDKVRLQQLAEQSIKGVRANGQIQAADVALTREKDRRDRTQVAYDEALTARDAGPSHEQIAEQNDAASNAQEQLDLANHALNIMDPKPDDLRRAAEGARSRLEAVKQLEAGGPCPTCKSPMTAEHLSKLRLNFGGERDEYNRELVAAEELEAHLEGQRNGCFAALEGAETTHASLSVARRSLESTRDRAETHRDEAQDALVAAQSARNGIGAPVDVTAIDAEIATLQQRIAAWDEYDQRAGDIDTLASDITDAEKTVELWQWLVEKFGSGEGSYRKELLGDGLKPLEDAINRVLKQVLGQTVVFPSGDSGLQVNDGTSTRTAEDLHLSGSERLRLSIALQYAFAKVLNFPLLLIDAEAALDFQVRAEILTLCRNLTEEWPELTILLTMVPTRADWTPINNEWCQTWEVVDGTVVPTLADDSPFVTPVALPDEIGEEQRTLPVEA